MPINEYTIYDCLQRINGIKAIHLLTLPSKAQMMGTFSPLESKAAVQVRISFWKFLSLRIFSLIICHIKMQKN